MGFLAALCGCLRGETSRKGVPKDSNDQDDRPSVVYSPSLYSQPDGIATPDREYVDSYGVGYKIVRKPCVWAAKTSFCPCNPYNWPTYDERIPLQKRRSQAPSSSFSSRQASAPVRVEIHEGSQVYTDVDDYFQHRGSRGRIRKDPCSSERSNEPERSKKKVCYNSSSWTSTCTDWTGE